jgi:hypothetical protein
MEPSQTNLVQTIASYLSKVHLNIIYPPTSWFRSSHFPSGFRTNNLYTFAFSPILAICPAHLILLDLLDIGSMYKHRNNKFRLSEQCLPAKCWLNFTWLHGIVSQKIELFIAIQNLCFMMLKCMLHFSTIAKFLWKNSSKACKYCICLETLVFSIFKYSSQHIHRLLEKWWFKRV